MTDIRSRALAYIRNGRVRVVKALPDEWRQRDRAAAVAGRVQGHRDTYWPIGKDGEWRCSCSASELMTTVTDQCAHVAALALVTGWPSAATRPAEEQIGATP